jgi:DNA polymerase (family 10)
MRGGRRRREESQAPGEAIVGPLQPDERVEGIQKHMEAIQPRGRSVRRKWTPAGYAPAHVPLSNADLSRRLVEKAHTLAAQDENPYKVRAYRRAAETVAGLSQSVAEEIGEGRDLTRYPDIGKGIAAELREIVQGVKLGQLDLPLEPGPPELAAVREYPRLDPQRVRRVYQKFGICSVEDLKARLAAGDIATEFGLRMAEHFIQAFSEKPAVLLHAAEPMVNEIVRFLREECGVTRTEISGAFRRREEVIAELCFLVATESFPALIERLQRFGGGSRLVSATEHTAVLRLPVGLELRVIRAAEANWGMAQVMATGAKAHLEKLEAATGLLQSLAQGKGAWPDEVAVYAALGLTWIPPELREGHDEVDRARRNELPALVRLADVRGDLHVHTTSSDGSHTIEQMARAAQAKGYAYVGITDHSRSLKIARGVAEADLWRQIRAIDELNNRLSGIRVLKGAEVDILPDGTLDYSDELLAQLDYTVCSIHSGFQLGRDEQTERIMRAMDHPSFRILGHATGRLLLKRAGYPIDVPRLIEHARDRGRFFEINASPDRLDLPAESVRLVAAAGVKVAVCTDAHHMRELNHMACGIDVARRAGLEASDLINCLPLPSLLKTLHGSRERIA